MQRNPLADVTEEDWEAVATMAHECGEDCRACRNQDSWGMSRNAWLYERMIEQAEDDWVAVGARDWRLDPWGRPHAETRFLDRLEMFRNHAEDTVDVRLRPFGPITEAEHNKIEQAKLDRIKRDTERKIAQEKAAARAEALLVSQLSKKQRREYKKNKHFHVIAGGRRLRITHGSSHNVKEMKGRKVVRTFCALPQGVPIADIMLTQKLLLESNPDEFFKIANVNETERNARWNREHRPARLREVRRTGPNNEQIVETVDDRNRVQRRETNGILTHVRGLMRTVVNGVLVDADPLDLTEIPSPEAIRDALSQYGTISTDVAQPARFTGLNPASDEAMAIVRLVRAHYARLPMPNEPVVESPPIALAPNLLGTSVNARAITAAMQQHLAHDEPPRIVQPNEVPVYVEAEFNGQPWGIVHLPEILGDSGTGIQVVETAEIVGEAPPETEEAIAARGVRHAQAMGVVFACHDPAGAYENMTEADFRANVELDEETTAMLEENVRPPTVTEPTVPAVIEEPQPMRAAG